jgi:hypothetical protein
MFWVAGAQSGAGRAREALGVAALGLAVSLDRGAPSRFLLLLFLFLYPCCRYDADPLFPIARKCYLQGHGAGKKGVCDHG